MANISDVITVPKLTRFLSKITPDWLGLGNVNNTADTDKYVAYAQRAGEADKVQNTLTLRLNGGRTEGSNMWTFDGSTSRSINITAEKVGALPADGGTLTGELILTEGVHYGTTLPAAGKKGRIFLKKVSS